MYNSICSEIIPVEITKRFKDRPKEVRNKYKNLPKVSYFLIQKVFNRWIEYTYKTRFNSGFDLKMLNFFKYEIVINPYDFFTNRENKLVKYYAKSYDDFIKRLYSWIKIRNCESYYYFEFKNGVIYANIFTY